MQSWPIFLLVNCYGTSVQYRGSLSKSHITRFLNTVINPLHRITKPDDIVELLARYDVSLLWYLKIINVLGYSFYLINAYISNR